MSVKEKLLSCVFLDGVLCSYRKSVVSGVMVRCFECEHYKRFMREMEEADGRMMDEIDFIHKYGYEVYDLVYKKGKAEGGV